MMSREGGVGEAQEPAAGAFQRTADPAERALAGKVRELLAELRPVLEELADDPGE